MKVGIVGKQGSGKTTLFQALTKGSAPLSYSKEPVHSVVVVPDVRFDWFVKLYNPKKITPATIEFVDDVARMTDEPGKELSDAAAGELRLMDAILYIINAFDVGEPTPDYVLKEAASFQDELGLRDLVLIEARLERIEKQLRTANAPASLKVEKLALEKVQQSLESGKKYAESELEENEAKAISGFQLLTAKPVVIAVNVGDDQLSRTQSALKQALDFLTDSGAPAFCLSAELEREISMLDENDQQVFLADLGLTTPVSDRVIRAIYSGCRLITFFTVGEKEVHAWPLRQGSTALEAADSIHSDLARGFIRCEIISWGDIQAAGGWDEAKDAGKLKLVGKEYPIQDGDSVFIRFKV